jgi:hypothetical protein
VVLVELPGWSFEAALYIAEQRKSKFRNRFPSQKLRALHEGESYTHHSESIIGYLGDIGSCLLLGLDPVQMFCDMIDATDGLAHRDQFDLWYNGYNLDAKIEDFAEYHQRVVDGLIQYKEPYGCRLINGKQWEENHGFTDIYLFGCFDPPMSERHLLHHIGRIRWLGFSTAGEVEQKEIKKFSPAGGWLPRPAKLIPHSELHSIEEFMTLPTGRREKSLPKVRDLASEGETIARIELLSKHIRKIGASPAKAVRISALRPRTAAR